MPMGEFLIHQVNDIREFIQSPPSWFAPWLTLVEGVLKMQGFSGEISGKLTVLFIIEAADAASSPRGPIIVLHTLITQSEFLSFIAALA